MRYLTFEQYLQSTGLRWHFSDDYQFVVTPPKAPTGAWCISDREVGYLSGQWDTTFAPDGSEEWKAHLGWRNWALKYPHLTLENLPKVIHEPMPGMMLPLCYDFIKWRMENGI